MKARSALLAGVDALEVAGVRAAGADAVVVFRCSRERGDLARVGAVVAFGGAQAVLVLSTWALRALAWLLLRVFIRARWTLRAAKGSVLVDEILKHVPGHLSIRARIRGAGNVICIADGIIQTAAQAGCEPGRWRVQVAWPARVAEDVLACSPDGHGGGSPGTVDAIGVWCVEQVVVLAGLALQARRSAGDVGVPARPAR